MKILVVDSDRDMVEMLTGWLRSRGDTVYFTGSADRIRSMWQEHEPDLVILDVQLAGVDVLAICRELRTQHDALILALAAERDPLLEAQCLELGADAFLCKPFLPRQLLGHIHALGRRVRSTVQQRPSAILVAGSLLFDASRNEVTINRRRSRLTPTESRILQLLVINAGHVCTLDQIVSHAWGYRGDGDTYLIKAHVRHLREKIEPEPGQPHYIHTVPGVGYMFSVDESQPAQDTVIDTVASSLLSVDMDADMGADVSSISYGATCTGDAVDDAENSENAGDTRR